MLTKTSYYLVRFFECLFGAFDPLKVRYVFSNSTIQSTKILGSLQLLNIGGARLEALKAQITCEESHDAKLGIRFILENGFNSQTNLRKQHHALDTIFRMISQQFSAKIMNEKSAGRRIKIRIRRIVREKSLRMRNQTRRRLSKKLQQHKFVDRLLLVQMRNSSFFVGLFDFLG